MPDGIEFAKIQEAAMRALATLAAALCVGLGTAAAQEPPPDGDNNKEPAKSEGNWFTRCFFFGRKAEEKKPPPAADNKKPTVTESAAVVRAREEAALHRRQAVCLKLHEIALSTNDEELHRKADELDRLAWDTYVQRTAHLPGSAAAFESDEQILTQRLGPRAEDGRSLPPTANSRATGAAGVAARRE
jgi:hypothetical protein